MAINLFNNLLTRTSTALFGTRPARPSDAELDTQRTKLLSEFNGTVTRAAHGLADGTITADEFEALMKAEIRSNELANAVIGAGGAHLANADTYATAQAAVDQQMDYFDAWMADIRAGNIGTAQQMATRARMYGASSGQTFERASVQAMGVPDLPFYPASQTICHANCNCGWDIQPLRGNGNYDCYYRTHPGEHCATCLNRAAIANPLRVRNGVIVNAERYHAANLYA